MAEHTHTCMPTHRQTMKITLYQVYVLNATRIIIQNNYLIRSTRMLTLASFNEFLQASLRHSLLTFTLAEPFALEIFILKVHVAYVLFCRNLCARNKKMHLSILNLELLLNK